MFEKEAEEIANKRCHEIMCFGHCSFSSPKHHRCGEWHREYECALKGAEFGYNKANEWHKQESDDIYDVISQDWNIRYFICIMKDKSRVLAIGSCDEDCNGLVGVNLFFEYDDEKYYIDDIVWWKEIVLPELPKES